MSFFDDEVGQSARDKFSEALAHIMLRWKDPQTHEERKPGHPFFHTFASSLRYVETDGFGDESKGEKKDPLALAAVGFTGSSPVGRLYINPENFLNLNIRQASGLVVHEILHIVYDHLHYEQQRTHPKIWNIATDCTINQQVEAMGYKLPEGKNILNEDPEHEVRCITPQTLGDIFKCAPPRANENALFYFDWIVDKLKEQEKKKKPCQSCGGTGQKSQQGQSGQDGDEESQGQDGEEGGDGNGQQPGGQGGGNSNQHDPNGKEPCDCCNGSGQQGGGGTGDQMLDELNGMTNHAHWDDLTPEEKEILRRFEAQATQAAKQHHDGCSGLPGEIAGQIANKVKALEPEIDWQHELRRFVGGIGTCDLRIKKTRLNKYDMPGKHVMQPNAAIAVVRDTSGSVSDTEFGKFEGEVRELANTFNVAVYVVDCDHAVQRTYWFGEDGDEVGGEDYVGRAGYGGTCMSDAFKLIQEQMAARQIDVGGVVCMTDGELPVSSFLKKESGWYLPLLYIFTRESSKWPDGSDWRGAGSKGEYLGELIYFKNKGKKLGER